MNLERIAQLRQMAERGTICKGHITEMLDAIEQSKPLTDEAELTNGLAMALHDAVLIRIGKDDEATRQATARIDKLVNKYKDEAAHGIHPT